MAGAIILFLILLYTAFVITRRIRQLRRGQFCSCGCSCCQAPCKKAKQP